MIFTFSLKTTHTIHAIIATKYLHTLPVEICILSGCFALERYISKMYVLIRDPSVPIIKPNKKELDLIKYKINVILNELSKYDAEPFHSLCLQNL